ncbi:NACHT domain-containing protein [Streptomyces sp. NPDC087300]|uniref:NACHT domain-containing protein n=1 Tax=Streptomyces sp. NPDC087300 TaxID=3365780 RepID=UPI0038240453
MELAGIGLRVASSAVAPLVRKLFRQDDPGAGLVDEPVRLSALVSFRGERRTLTEQELRKLARELVRRAVRSAGPHDSLPEDEQAAVAAELARSLHGLGDLDMDDAQAVRLGHEGLADALPRCDQGLSQDAQLLHERLVLLACLHIVEFFTKRSSFVARTLLEQTRQIDRIVTTLDLLVERVPAQSVEDAGFEERYRQYLVRRHGQLTIYGADFDDEWPLDVAYFSLEITERAERRTENGEQPLPSPPRRAERVLAECRRVLLRGGTGAGKTTLVQWLAVASEQQVSEGPAYLIGLVPFVLRVRHLLAGEGRLPGPERFLELADCPYAPPPGWAERVLEAGRGLLLIDDVDEVPQADREQVRRWIRQLLAAFPGNRWLVTTRPSAVPLDWLAAEGFTEFRLEPMREDDIELFIERWSRASPLGEFSGGELRSFLSEMRRREDFGKLATNPLLCTLLCTLHRDRRGYLPGGGRTQLYVAALQMMLTRRDRERGVFRSSLQYGLDPDAQLALLGELAYWMIRNDCREMRRSDAIWLIGRSLTAMAREFAGVGSTESGADVYRTLLEGSGLLREQADGVVDFAHPTFQDYLGARAALAARDLPLLVSNAHKEQWADVVRMAVAQGDPEDRARLLNELVSRGDEEEEHRVRLHLLALSCEEEAVRVDPEVRHLVEQRAAALLPPRSWQESVTLAAIGRPVLRLLPAPAGLTAEETVACVETAVRIGGAHACDWLSGALRDGLDGGASTEVHRVLGAAWEHFGTAQYAAKVLAQLPPDTPITVTSYAQLRRLDGPRHLRVGHGVPLEDVVAHVDRTRLRVLEAAVLEDAAALRELSALERLSTGRPSTEVLRSLSALPSLNECGLTLADPSRELPEVPSGTRVTALTLPSGARGLAELPRFPRLETLTLQGPDTALTPEDWRHLAAAPGLRHLVMPVAAVAPLHTHAGVRAHISSVTLTGQVAPADLELVAAAFPGLRTLRLRGSGAPLDVDLLPLARLAHLAAVHLESPGQVLNAEGLPGAEVTVAPQPRY